MVDSKNYNNVIQAVYPMLYDMYRECCKKSRERENKGFISAEDGRDTMLLVGGKLYEAKAAMIIEGPGIVSLSAVILEV